MAMNINLLLQEEIKVLHAENEQKVKKRVRRRAIVGNDVLLSVCYSLHWMGVVRVFIARRRRGAVICCSLLPPKARAIFAAIYLHKELSYIPMSKM
jgi:hypothetical protein